MSSNNFNRGKQEAIDNALNVLERLTSLSDAELDIIKAMVADEWWCVTCGTVECNHLPEDCACELWQPRKEATDE